VQFDSMAALEQRFDQEDVVLVVLDVEQGMAPDPPQAAPYSLRVISPNTPATT
jgi:hypothetical protein